MTRTIIIILLTVLLISVVAYAEHRGPKTPYGDFCSKCSKYGVCQDFMSVDESREAVDGYFDGKGIHVGHIRGRGRFLKIELIRDKEVHDVILFDRKTGRMRSIY
jgi:hypothetical protein